MTVRKLIQPYRDVFPDCFAEYMEEIRAAAKARKHHDQRRHIFLNFLQHGFGVDWTDVELEHKIKVAQVRGRIDALFKNVIFEFKTDLKAEMPAAELELAKYFASRPNPEEHLALVTDGIVFVAFQFEGKKPSRIAEFSLGDADELTAFRLLDQFIFSSKPVTPRSEDITRKFGLHSAVFNRARRVLEDLYALASSETSVQVKYREWNALLSRVYGSALGEESLFLRHTYLTMLSRLLVAKAIAPKSQRDRSAYLGLLTGDFFKAQNLANLAEPDFFSWALGTQAEQGFLGFLGSLESYLSVFDLSQITEDILKEVYQELVDPESRHALGEYYTPDWLADLTFEILQYSKGRVLDPACGSGSFLLAAIRRKKAQRLKGRPLLDFALNSIVGIDVHPLAVLMSKANIVLALADEFRKLKRDITLPVYMADTLLVSQDERGENIVVTVSESERFHIPLRPGVPGYGVDAIVDHIAHTAAVSGDEPAVLERGRKGLVEGVLHDMPERERFFWIQNYILMARLIAHGRESVYPYILKNAYRPAFLQKDKVDYVVGNPPWLSYRFVQDKGYRQRIKELSIALGLLQSRDTKLFTQMDTSTLFFNYCEREFLRPHGVIAFVLPKTTTLPSKQHTGFQSRGLSEIHDFTGVTPLFNVRSVLAVRSPELNATASIPTYFYSGALPRKNLTWREAEKFFDVDAGEVSFVGTSIRSPEYYRIFLQGATIVPRCLWFVQPQRNAAANELAPHMETDEDAFEEAKAEWKLRLQGQLEHDLMYETVLAKGILPFSVIRRERLFLPVRRSGSTLVMADSSVLLEMGRPQAARWMSRAEEIWSQSTSGKERSILDRLNYNQTLVSQDPSAPVAVVYNTSGTNVAAAVIEPRDSTRHKSGGRGLVFDAKTYYAYPSSRVEAMYLAAMLNSDVVNEMIKDFQPQGLYGERDIHRRPFEVCPIPKFDKSDKRHMRLSEIAEECEKVVSKQGPQLEGTLGRRRLGARMLIKDELAEINKLVTAIFAEAGARVPAPVTRPASSRNLLLFDLL